MDRTTIAAIFADQEALGGQTVTVCGWARTIRDILYNRKAQKRPTVSSIMIELFSSQVSPSFPAYSTLSSSLGLCLFTGFHFFFVAGQKDTALIS